jgi:hypothetical protein
MRQAAAPNSMQCTISSLGSSTSSGSVGESAIHDNSSPEQVLDLSVPAVVAYSHTHLQSNIVKPKVFTDDTVHYDRFGMLATCEPQTVIKALQDKNWKAAMDEEILALQRDDTWLLVPADQAQNIIDCKWVFKVKQRADGNIDHYKARLVANGFKQRYGLDYEDTFGPMVKMTTIHIILPIPVTNG